MLRKYHWLQVPYGLVLYGLDSVLQDLAQPDFAIRLGYEDKAVAPFYCFIYA